MLTIRTSPFVWNKMNVHIAWLWPNCSNLYNWGFKEHGKATDQMSEGTNEQMTEGAVVVGRTGSVTFWHGCVILAWNMDTAWMRWRSSLPTLSMNKAVRLFSFYFPNALQGTVTEMCNILVIALCLTPQKLCSDPKAAFCVLAICLLARDWGCWKNFNAFCTFITSFRKQLMG